MRTITLLIGALLAVACCGAPVSYPTVDTGVQACYGNFGPITPPRAGGAFFGQDGQYRGNEPSYRDNGDGTVSDLVTGLMWIKARGAKMTWHDAVAGAKACRTGGYTDWRMPAIKELYSLINFNGCMARNWSIADSAPYIDTRYFDFAYGNTQAGERPIDCQDWSVTEYIGTTMNGNPTVFGVNFADGRVKGYPKAMRDPRGQREHRLYVRYVRGNPQYGKNDFVDNRDGTVTDRATGLMWQKADSGKTFNWQGALAYAEGLTLAGHDDWRLPNAKELQSIVDYTRAPLQTRSAALDPIFSVTNIESYFWTGTTHLESPPESGAAVYLCFGRGMGYLQMPPGSGNLRFIDVHGAGAQRSDPKFGDPARFPQGRGPQGDDIRIYNYVRCVRNAYRN